MTVQLNHTIVWCSDQKRSAAFMTGEDDFDADGHLPEVITRPYGGG